MTLSVCEAVVFKTRNKNQTALRTTVVIHHTYNTITHKIFTQNLTETRCRFEALTLNQGEAKVILYKSKSYKLHFLDNRFGRV